MASYKVPQDVEADDKLLGPLSFRQFIYMLVALGLGGMTYFFAITFLPLILFTIPPFLLFLVLALPIKKDQPMETYLLAIISFYIKPRQRIWQPDGYDKLVDVYVNEQEIIDIKTSDLTMSQAQERFDFLANVVDSQGRSIRGLESNSTFDANFLKETDSTQDTHDDASQVSRNFDQMISEQDRRRREQLMSSEPSTTTFVEPRSADIQQPAVDTRFPSVSGPQAEDYSTFQLDRQVEYQQTSAPRLSTPATQPAVQPRVDQHQPQENLNPWAALSAAKKDRSGIEPYPTGMSQAVIQPTNQQHEVPVATTPPLPPATAPAVHQEPQQFTPQSFDQQQVHSDIANLARNENLSIEAIAKEAERINQQLSTVQEDEVVISLR